MELETVNKLYLELSKVATAKTANDLRLEKCIDISARRGKLLADIFNCDEAELLPLELRQRINNELMGKGYVEMTNEEVDEAADKLRDAFGVKKTSQTYGETVTLRHFRHPMGKWEKPEGCPCGWEDNGKTVKFTLQRGCPTHRPTPMVYPKPPFDEMA